MKVKSIKVKIAYFRSILNPEYKMVTFTYSSSSFSWKCPLWWVKREIVWLERSFAVLFTRNTTHQKRENDRSRSSLRKLSHFNWPTLCAASPSFFEMNIPTSDDWQAKQELFEAFWHIADWFQQFWELQVKNIVFEFPRLLKFWDWNVYIYRNKNVWEWNVCTLKTEINGH